MGLKNDASVLPGLTQSANSSAGKQGLIVEFQRSTNEGDTLVMEAKSMVTAGDIKEGDDLIIKFSGKFKDKAIESMKNGAGRGANSVLMLQNNARQEDGSFIGGWVRHTAVSNSKKMDGDERHELRSIRAALMDMPRIMFNNPEMRAGEPNKVSFPLTAASAPHQIKSSAGKFGSEVFSRDWAKAKLAGNENLIRDARITTNIYHVDESVKLESLADLKAEVIKVLSKADTTAFLRLNDGEDVFTYRLYKNWSPENGNEKPEAAVERLLSRNIFSYVDKETTADGVKEVRKQLANASVLEAIASGSATLEVFPVTTIPYLGKESTSTRSMILQAFINESSNILEDFKVFGRDAGAVALMGTVEEPIKSSKTGATYLAGTPIAMDDKSYPIDHMPTRFYDGSLAKPQVEQEAPAAVAEPVDEIIDGNLVVETLAENAAAVARQQAPAAEVAEPESEPAPAAKQRRTF